MKIMSFADASGIGQFKKEAQNFSVSCDVHVQARRKQGNSNKNCEASHATDFQTMKNCDEARLRTAKIKSSPEDAITLVFIHGGINWTFAPLPVFGESEYCRA